MDALRKLQHEFLDYLLDDSALDIVREIESTPRRSAEQRMALYGTAYVLRLKEALCTDYERLHAYLGDELFDRLMEQYIEAYPSHYTSLRYFGQHMVTFTQQTEPFSQYPEIAELARIEQAFADSFDAADGSYVTLDQLTALAADAWATLTLRFHSAVQLLPLQYNSFPIWQALSKEETPPQAGTDDTSWLIWRQDLVSRYRALESAEAAALDVALSTGSFADICAALLDYFDEQETPLQAVIYLKQWINNRLISELGY